VQIAKAFGAEVTAVCGSNHTDAARSIGADHVIDYSREDATKDGQKYDLILAVNGFRSIFAFRRALAPNGIYLFVGSSKIWRGLLTNIVLGPLISRLGKRKMGFMGIAKIKQEDLQYLAGLLESGKVKPLISKRYPLPEAAEAFREVGGGHAGGKVVVAV
jgi:NADPH:quinone reductase-like Zn-dependent oxidoreductase